MSAETRKELDIDRLKAALSLHPLEYGYRNSEPGEFGMVKGEYVAEPGDDATVTERYLRCPVCEQWSPCDFREMVGELEIVRRERDETRAELAARASGESGSETE